MFLELFKTLLSSRVFSYKNHGRPLGLELEHKIKIEHANRQVKSCSNSNAIGSQHGVRTRESRLERAMC